MKLSEILEEKRKCKKKKKKILKESSKVVIVTDIKWDADEPEDVADLPTTVEVAIPSSVYEDEPAEEIQDAIEEYIANYLSDEYGFTHDGFSVTIEAEDENDDEENSENYEREIRIPRDKDVKYVCNACGAEFTEDEAHEAWDDKDYNDKNHLLCPECGSDDIESFNKESLQESKDLDYIKDLAGL